MTYTSGNFKWFRCLIRWARQWSPRVLTEPSIRPCGWKEQKILTRHLALSLRQNERRWKEREGKEGKKEEEEGRGREQQGAGEENQQMMAFARYYSEKKTNS